VVGVQSGTKGPKHGYDSQENRDATNICINARTSSAARKLARCYCDTGQLRPQCVSWAALSIVGFGSSAGDALRIYATSVEVLVTTVERESKGEARQRHEYQVSNITSKNQTSSLYIYIFDT